ncbi:MULTISPECIES: class I SAM-dependent methyltransferase [unclassified Streptomyces]|uniref:class I SAM-dependent methyltransferase n=1 Tax=unclassified Streptomyces TaxID=2593676 RepID=UPI002E362096|nr:MULTISPECIES: methyltransferase domain-containing protein [unclassified Streptomyces]WUC63358.1 methyltransferase domain-containing protein [Streptomyces sp. NBC_00539]
MTEQRFDVWAAGEAYERYMGRWSRLVADRFVDWLGVAEGAVWLDAGCGTGALTSSVARRARPRLVVGADRSAGFLTAARAAVAPPARFVLADALSLPVRDAAFDAVVSALVLNFLPAPGAAVAEAARAARPGGLVACYVWDYAEGMELLYRFWEAAAPMDPAAAAVDERRRFPLCRPEELRALWTAAGLDGVHVAPIGVRAEFASFADLWEPFLAGQGPAPGYVAALAPPERERLRTALRAALPSRPDGSLTLGVRAWAVLGRKASSGAA